MLSEIHLTGEEAATPEDPVLDFVYLGNHRVAILTGDINAGENPCFVATAAMAGTTYNNGLRILTGSEAEPARMGQGARGNPHFSVGAAGAGSSNKLAASIMGVWARLAPMTEMDLDALRAFRDRVLKAFNAGRAFVDWYYEKGPKAANWLNAHPGWKPVVRTGLIVPISLSKLIVASKLSHKIAALLLVFGCIGLAVSAGRHEKWSKSKTAVTGIMLAFLAVIVYGIVMTPKPAFADRTVYNLDSQEVYFFYEDHIGKPVLMSEYDDYDSDGSYFDDGNANEYPFWQATYTPFGSVYEDFDSTGITVGKEPDTQISWTVPFRFPGQYADPELNGGIYYNWNRYYAPEIGRYNRADPLIADETWSTDIFTDNPSKNLYAYVASNPISLIDPSGLKFVYSSRKCKNNCPDCPGGNWTLKSRLGVNITVGLVYGRSRLNVTLTCKTDNSKKCRGTIYCTLYGPYMGIGFEAYAKTMKSGGAHYGIENAPCASDLYRRMKGSTWSAGVIGGSKSHAAVGISYELGWARTICKIPLLECIGLKN